VVTADPKPPQPSLPLPDFTHRANEGLKKVGKEKRAASTLATVEQLMLELGDGFDATLRTHHDRAWVEIDQLTYDRLSAVEGDKIVVGLHAHGNRCDVSAIMGSAQRSKRVARWRIWLTEWVETDAVEAVTLRRSRPV
jgi:hypothetical protein